MPPEPAPSPRRPAVPTWLLTLVVLACLLGAGALFWRDAQDDSPASRATPAEEKELAEGELRVPDDESDDGGRRGDPGRDRLDQGRGGSDDAIDDPADASDDADEAAEQQAQLPAVFRNLAGVRVAVLPASLDAGSRSDQLVAIGGLRVACAAIGNPGSLEAELRTLRAVDGVLRRAGAHVDLLRPEQLAGRGACVDARVRQLERAEFAVVVRATDEPGRVLAGRPPAGAGAGSRRDSAVLAAELAAALGLRAPRTADAATRTLLARAAAIDMRGGAAVAFLELPMEAAVDPHETAISIGRGVAVTASRANGT